jgi:acetyl esterase/lipase
MTPADPARRSSAVTRRAALAGLGAGLGAGVLATAGRSAAQGGTPVPQPTASPPTVETMRNVAYGEAGGTPLLLDIYRPVGWEGPRHIVLIFHGGGLIVGDRTMMVMQAMGLAHAGYLTLAVGYRLFDPDTGTNPWPAQLDDAQRAVRWARANAATYGGDPDHVASYGFSSGGTLAAAVGVRETRDDSDPALAGISSRVNSVIDLSGDMDLTIPYPDPFWNEVYAAMLGGTPDEQPEAYRDASPLFQVDADSAPFLIIHGTDDIETPVEHSRRMVAALRGAGVEVTYGEYPKVGHFVTEQWAFNGPWALAFLGPRRHR